LQDTKKQQTPTQPQRRQGKLLTPLNRLSNNGLRYDLQDARKAARYALTIELFNIQTDIAKKTPTFSAAPCAILAGGLEGLRTVPSVRISGVPASQVRNGTKSTRAAHSKQIFPIKGARCGERRTTFPPKRWTFSSEQSALRHPSHSMKTCAHTLAGTLLRTRLS